MKKKHLSILVIVMTIIAVAIMLYSTMDANENGYTMVQDKNMEENKIQDSKVDDKGDIISENNKEIKEEPYEEEQGSEEKVGQDDNKKENNDYEYKVEENLKEENEELFKVDKNVILNNLSKEEQKELRKLIKKLSINDYISIVSSIKNDGELECCSKIVTILNKRLSTEDYNKAKEILDPYVNIDYLEEIVLNK